MFRNIFRGCFRGKLPINNGAHEYSNALLLSTCFRLCFRGSTLTHPYPYRGGGRGGQNQPVEFHFFLLGNPGIVIHPLEWNCIVTFLNKPWALVRKHLRLAPPYDHGSAIFWRDAIPTHVLLQSDMCLAPPELSASI